MLPGSLVIAYVLEPRFAALSRGSLGNNHLAADNFDWWLSDLQPHSTRSSTRILEIVKTVI
jgi:hypothetical protein